MPSQRIDLLPLRGDGVVQRLDGFVLKRQSRFEHIDALAERLHVIHRNPFGPALPQSVAERDAVVEHKTFATPAALGLRYALEISEDAALEVIDLRKTVREQIGAGLLAADAAGAEHRDPAVFRRIEMAGGKILELPKTPYAGIDGAGKCTHRNLECVAGVDHQRIRTRDQRVPVCGVDINADLPGRVGMAVAEGNDLLFQPDLQALKRHRGGMREFQFEVVEPAAEQSAALQFLNQCGNRLGLARQRAVDAFMGQQHAAIQLQSGADRAQRLAQLPEIWQRGELIESSDPVRHHGGLSGRRRRGNPDVVPANVFAATTLILSYAPPAIAHRLMNMPCNPAPRAQRKMTKVSNLA